MSANNEQQVPEHPGTAWLQHGASTTAPGGGTPPAPWALGTTQDHNLCSLQKTLCLQTPNPQVGADPCLQRSADQHTFHPDGSSEMLLPLHPLPPLQQLNLRCLGWAR